MSQQPNRNELAVIQTDEWTVLKQYAETLVASGFLPQSVNTAQKALAIITLGRELGVGAWAALTTINVIQGKPTVSPQLMLALINRSGQLENMQVQDEGGTVHVMMKRRSRTEHWEAFGQADAEKMGLWGKDNWRKQPATMMKWRAVAACARIVFPDVILGLYTPEEMGADVTADEQGNMTVVEVTQPSASVRGAGIPQKPQEEAMQHPQAPDTRDEAQTYLCDAMTIQASSQDAARSYVFHAPTKQNIVLTDSSLFDGLGFDPRAWKAGKYPLSPAVSVTAWNDADGWHVESISDAVPVE